MDREHPIERYRRKRRLSRADLAAALGVATVTIWRWETGERFPSRKLWPRIREVTGIRPAELAVAEVCR